jgi:hypothetical protein
VVPTGLGDLASTFSLAVPGVLAVVLEGGYVPASDFHLPTAVAGLRHWLSGKAVPGVL